MTPQLTIKAILGTGLLCIAAGSQALPVTLHARPGLANPATGQTFSLDDRTRVPTAPDPDAYFGGQASVSAEAAAPVPEPQTYAMLLAGIVAIALVAQRRRP